MNHVEFKPEANRAVCIVKRGTALTSEVRFADWAGTKSKNVSALVAWVPKAVVTGKQLIILEDTMKIWSKPEVRETEVGLEVTSYLPAEIDLI